MKRRPSREVECHLGDVPRWMERWAFAIIVISGIALLSALILAAIILALMFAAKPSLA